MLLALNSVAKAFSDETGTVAVLRDVSCSLDAGETLALTGESGSGKSTLLHIAAGLDLPDSGTVMLDADTLSAQTDAGRAALRRGKIGFVFQQFNLIPSLTVRANVEFQARLARKLDPDHIAHLVAELKLEPHQHKYPEALSGGQQQRVAIARALAARPRLLLADEPTGNLDENTAGNVLNAMLSLVNDTGAALMVVTHSATIAARMERRLHLSGGALT
ncbi:MAG: ABC transporter ATP-binding protein [Pseudomonadota bacterium]